MINGIIGSSNSIGTILNGYTQTQKTARGIHSVLKLTSCTLKMENRHIILLEIHN